jgi:tetratricopeptide (TPR) repeat protein
MGKKNQLLDLLAKSHQYESSFISELGNEERALSGTSQEWAVKDEIVHLAAWKAIMAERFAASMAGKNPPDYDDWDAVNEELFQRHKDKTWQEVLELREYSYQELVEQIRLIPEGDLVGEQRYAWLKGRSLWERAIQNAYFHPHWHIALLYRRRGQPELGSQLMEDVTRTLVSLDESPGWQGQSIYNLACYYAQAGDKAKAIENLRLAFSLRPDLIEWALEDADLMAIRDEPGFLALVN